MSEITTIKNKIEKLFNEESDYKISKNANIPYQTVQDLRNGRTNLEDAKFKTITKLYEYALNEEKS
ncbi:hypothetical protein [Staphylococcus carnosus]|uniref:hypothetical protein n=1 Tax=Staphylococcus carnosus TaxID=1281 RepID=UPI00081A4E02|nr:hypothetical protein [Staphylococcus carnosus]ANZ32354.1 hypothetical protein BEK99_00070 [Staphylococcus carnosus]UTB79713.1 hypothetical protein A2I65_01800 [Staphylococcus carnosus]UTB84481.1 hypothetical protein A2I66_01700 [Staphylococcus carnosus]